jgi:hypothetical protein
MDAMEIIESILIQHTSVLEDYTEEELGNVMVGLEEIYLEYDDYND